MTIEQLKEAANLDGTSGTHGTFGTDNPRVLRYFAMRTHLMLLVVVALCLTPLSAAAPTVRPERVGLSTERLKRIGEVDATAHCREDVRRGRVARRPQRPHRALRDARAGADLKTKKPMQKDAIFRIMSMTKPVVGAAVMMLVEEGKVRLADPVPKFIPDLQGLSAVVLNTEGRVAPAPSGAVTAAMPSRNVPHGHDDRRHGER